MCIYGIIVGRRFSVKKAALLMMVAAGLAVTSFLSLVAVAISATREIKLQAAHVLQHGYISSTPQVGLDLSFHYWVVGVAMTLTIFAIFIALVSLVVGRMEKSPKLTYEEQRGLQHWGTASV